MKASAGEDATRVAGGSAVRARASRRSGPRAMPAAARTLAWLFGGSVAAALALRPALGDEIFLTRYTGYVMPWLLLGLVPGLVWAGLARRWALASVLSVSVAVIAAIHVPLFLPRERTAAHASMTLTVMSYNTWSKNDDSERIARVIRAHAPDLLLLQEIRPEVFQPLRHALRGLYGGRVVYWSYEREIKQAVMSRYPLDSRTSMPDKGQAQQVVLHFPGGPITIFNVHPLRTGGWRDRYRQVRALLEDDVLLARWPVILGGDLNANDRSQLYGLLARRLENAHEAAGFGFGFTYPSAVRVGATFPVFPMARIDHLFFSEHFVALRAGTLEDSGGSDHRPVFAKMALTSNGRDTTASSRFRTGPGRAAPRPTQHGAWASDRHDLTSLR